MDLPPAAEWEGAALCKQTDPELFFPEKNQGTHHAKAVCHSCEVTAECLEKALAGDEKFGVWGGLTPNQRRALKPRQPDTRRATCGTRGGYERHMKQHTAPCDDCKEAKRIYQRQYRKGGAA